MSDSRTSFAIQKLPSHGNQWLGRAFIGGALLALLIWGASWIIHQRQLTALVNARQNLLQLSLERTATARSALVQQASQELGRAGVSGTSPAATVLRFVVHVLSATDGDLPGLPSESQLMAAETDDLLLAAEALLGVRKLGLAEPIAKTALARTDQRQRVLQLMVSVEYELGNDELVLDCCHEWEQLDPRAAIPWLVTAFVFENRGKLQLVIEPLRQAIERLPPPAILYRTQLVDYLLQLRQVAAARKEFEMLQSLVEFPAISLTEARLLFAEGESARSLEMAQSLLRSTPDDPAVMALVGRILLATNKPEAALPTLAGLVERFPYDAESHYLVGQALARLRRVDEAKLHLDRHQSLVHAKTAIHRLQRQAAAEPDNLQLRLELVRQCEAVHWDEKALFWRDAAEALRSSREARERRS